MGQMGILSTFQSSPLSHVTLIKDMNLVAYITLKKKSLSYMLLLLSSLHINYIVAWVIVFIVFAKVVSKFMSYF